MNDPVIDIDLNHQEKEEMIVTETDDLKDVVNHREIRHTQITNDLTAEKIVDKKIVKDLDNKIGINRTKDNRTTNGKTANKCHLWHNYIICTKLSTNATPGISANANGKPTG